MRSDVRAGRLRLSDLRMGLEPDYTFQFEVAQRDGGGWRGIAPRQLQWHAPTERLGTLWQRIWQAPGADATAGSGVRDEQRAAQ